MFESFFGLLNELFRTCYKSCAFLRTCCMHLLVMVWGKSVIKHDGRLDKYLKAVCEVLCSSDIIDVGVSL